LASSTTISKPCPAMDGKLFLEMCKARQGKAIKDVSYMDSLGIWPITTGIRR